MSTDNQQIPDMFLGIFVREKRFYQTFFPLLAVIALQQVATLTVNLVDNLMLGSYSELALSGATLVNQIQYTLQQLVGGIGIGIVVLASQYWGRKDTDAIKKIVSLGIKFSFLTGLIFFLLTMLLPSGMLRIFTNDETVIAEGVRYLRIMCWTYPIFSLSGVLVYSLQSVETAYVGTIMSVSTICINASLNYVLIYGNFGAPELGVVGAAIATVISRMVELIIILVYLFRIDPKLKLKPMELLELDLTYLKDYVKVAAPLVLGNALWGVSMAVQASVLGHINEETIAANSIASAITQIFVVVGLSCANAASVTIGKTVGEKRFPMIRPYTRTLQAIFLLIGVASGLSLFLCKDAIVSLYAVSSETRELALKFLNILSLTIVGTCYEYPVASGIIAGGGDTKYPAIIENLFMWLFILPSSALSAFVFHWPATTTYWFLKIDQLLKCIPNSIYCNRYKWVKVLTRDTPPGSSETE